MLYTCPGKVSLTDCLPNRFNFKYAYGLFRMPLKFVPIKFFMLFMMIICDFTQPPALALGTHGSLGRKLAQPEINNTYL